MSGMPTAYRNIIEPLIEIARGIVEQGETLSHMAFVGNLRTGETKIVPMVTPSDEAKDEAAAMLRHVAHLLQADFVFVIMNAWTLPPDKVARYREILDEYGSIGGSPYRIDAIAFNLEARTACGPRRCRCSRRACRSARRPSASRSSSSSTACRGVSRTCCR